MKRLLVILAVSLLAFFAVPGPAKAAPIDVTKTCRAVPVGQPTKTLPDDLLLDEGLRAVVDGIVGSIPVYRSCLAIADSTTVMTIEEVGGGIIATYPLTIVDDAITQIPGLPPVVSPGSPTPGPVAPAPAPAPATVTQTRVIPGPTPEPEKITETVTVTAPAAPTTAEPTPTNAPTGQSRSRGATVSAAPPSMEQPEAGIDLIPDDPEAAAATYSLLGLLVGILIGVAGLYAAYRRGQINGEKDTLREFLGVIRGTAPRHRA